MKTLIIMRHAEAPHNFGMSDDFDRKLNENGLIQAQQSAKHLLSYGALIDKILCSPSLRTKQTLSVLEESGIKSKIKFHDEIYRTSEDKIMELICAQEAKNETIMVLGHNPTISYLYFTAIHNHDLNHFSPATCAILHYKEGISWANIFHSQVINHSVFIP